MCLGMPTKPLWQKNNRAADTVKLHWCVHQGKITTTFCTSCWYLLTNYNVVTCIPQQCLHVVTAEWLMRFMSQHVYPPKASIHASVRATCILKVKNIIHITPASIELNIKQVFNSNYLMWDIIIMRQSCTEATDLSPWDGRLIHFLLHT